MIVIRANFPIRSKVISQREIPSKPDNNIVTIQSDEIVFLINKKQQQTQYSYRLIKGIINETGQTICFNTNILEEEAYSIAETYRQRWGIEVFF